MSESRCALCDRTYVAFKLSTGEKLDHGYCLPCSAETERRKKENPKEPLTPFRDGVFIRETNKPVGKIIHTPKIVRDITEAFEQLAARKKEAIKKEQYEEVQEIKETEENFIKRLSELLKALD